MPEVDHGGVRIRFSVQGEGPPLLLHHGTGSNRTTWIRHGYAKALRDSFRLILIDARGHGQSDKPVSPEAHTLPLRVGDVVAVLDALSIPRAHFLGYSMGGFIGFGMAQHAPERLLSLALGGAHPFADPEFDALQHIDPSNPDDFLRGLELVIGESLDEETRRLLLHNDRRAVLETLKQRVPLDAVVSRIQVPSFLFAGTADRRYELIVRARESIEGATLLSLPGLGHLDAFTHSEHVIPELARFLQGPAGDP